MKPLLLFVGASVLAAVPSIGQSLADVLSSIQERKLLLEQAQAQIRVQPDYDPGRFYPGGDSGTFELISWTGVAAAFPTDADLTSLGIDDRVRLLNEARRHFQIIRAAFVNVAPERLDPTSEARPPAVIRRFDELSLPTPAVADHQNYVPILRELACKVDVLRVTPWPVAYTLTTGTIVNGLGQVTQQSTGADKIEWSEINHAPNDSPRHFWAPEHPVGASYWIAGRNHELNVGTPEVPVWQPREFRHAQRVWPSEFALTFSPTSLTLPPGVSAVEGSCVVLAEQLNSPCLSASGTGISADPIPLKGGYTILVSANSAGNHAIASPEWVVSGAWESTGNSPNGSIRNEQRFVPAPLFASNYEAYFTKDTSYAYGLLVCVVQNVVFLMVADFEKGLDADGGGGAPADYSWDRPRSPRAPGELLVSGGAAKLALDAGRGESMFVEGTVQIQHGWTKFPDVSGNSLPSPQAITDALWGHPNGSTGHLDFFTDKANHRRFPLIFGSQLRFAGPERDYEVLYETRFDHGRAALADWPVTELVDSPNSWQHGMAYYWEWQKPRLRQVLGREALIDIVQTSDDYTHSVSVYRVPVAHTVAYDSNGFVQTTGLALLKSVSIEGPTLDNDGFPMDDLAMEVGADGGEWTVQGSAGNDMPDYPVDWEVTLEGSGGAGTLVVEDWSSVVDYSASDQMTTNPIASEAPILNTVTVVRTFDGAQATAVSSTFTADSLRSLVADPLPRITSISAAGNAGTPTTALGYESGANAPEFPTTITVTAPGEPVTEVRVNSSGIVDYVERGTGATQWRTDWSDVSGGQLDGGLVAVHSFGGAVFARNWTAWEDEGWTVTQYRAADGALTDPAATEVDWERLVIGRIGGSGFAGLPHLLTRKDGSGSKWDWTVNDTTSVQISDGLLSGESVTRGTREVVNTNERGYVTSTENYLIQSSGELQTAGTSTPTGAFSPWGAPLEVEDYTSDLASTRTFDGARDRLASATDAFGNNSTFSAYDALERPTGFSWRGHTGSATYNNGGFGVASTLSIPGRTIEQSRSWDAIGRSTGGSVTAGGTSNFTLAHGASGKTLTTGDTVTGASATMEFRPEDGSLDTATGNTLAFGGLDGTSLTVEADLLKATTSLAELATAFRTTWTDAWGRVRRTAVTGTDGANDDETNYLYSAPGSTTKRIETHHASGLRTIQEVEPWAAAGIVTRSGVDKNENGVLDGGDRLITTLIEIATVANPPLLPEPAVRTTVTQTGNPTALMVRDYNPSNGVTTITLNGGEEVITETPNFPAKTSTIVRKRNGATVETNVVTLNHLGQPDFSRSFGTGLPFTTANPTFREDGSLQSFSLTIAGATSSVGFKDDGRIDTITHPLLGPLSVSHTFGGGQETLTVDGTTSVRALDGTSASLAGHGVMDRKRHTAVAGGNFEETIDPGDPAQAQDPYDGESTKLVSNAAGAKTGHDYLADGDTVDASDRTISWQPGGQLDTVSLGRGGNTVFGYSADGARDLVSLTWPSASSAGFGGEPFYGDTIDLERDETGNLVSIADRSGERDLAYEKNRLTTTDWLNGELNSYKVLRAYDSRGRLGTVTLHRNEVPVHTIGFGYNGESDEVSGVTAAGFSASYSRDANSRLVTGITRPGATQTWGRGTAGRIVSAGSNLAGAPSFAYTAFDSKGRRQTVETNRGDWTYGYRDGETGDGQLASAGFDYDDATPNLSFTYGFDGIGRRGEFTGNGTDPLNRLVAIEHPLDDKKLFLAADPEARLYAAQGTDPLAELTPFDGNWVFEIDHPGTAGGWVPWAVEGVLGEAGDPGAHPDAVAALAGLAWFPPKDESFTYDADGNRESSSLWDYGWDGRNRLVRARTRDWQTAGEGWDLRFDYDAEGRRFKKDVTRFAAGQPVERKMIYFVWDGWDLLCERHEDGHGNAFLERHYVWGLDLSGTRGGAGGAGGLLLMREIRGQSTEDYFPLYDGNGHVVGLADDGGNLVAEYWRGPFGELIEAKGTMAQANPWRYATKYFDAETGLYYFGHRYYDPVTGQWLNREPLGEEESLNLYAYCHNDPVNRVDVLGLREYEIIDPNPLTRFKKINGELHVNLVTERTGFWHGFAGIEDKSIVAGSGRYVPTSTQSLRLLGFAEYNEQGGVTTPGNDLIAETMAIARPTLQAHAKVGSVVAMGEAFLLAAPILGATAPAIVTEGGIAVHGYGTAALSSVGATSFTVGGTGMLGSGTTLTLGQVGTAGLITAETGMLAWVLGTDEGREYGSMVGSSGLPPQQQAAMLGFGGSTVMLRSSSWFQRPVVLNPAMFADDVARIRAESAARHGLNFPGAEHAMMMAGRRALKPGENLIGFIQKDGTLIGEMATLTSRFGHAEMAAAHNLTGAAQRGDIISFTVGKSSTGKLNAFGSGSFPPPGGGAMPDSVRALILRLVE